MATLRVVARVTALPDKISQLQEVLQALLEPTRQESGCLQYNLYQNTADPTDFTFVEEWESSTALNTHLASPHIQKAIQQVEGLVAVPPDIRSYQLLG